MARRALPRPSLPRAVGNALLATGTVSRLLRDDPAMLVLNVAQRAGRFAAPIASVVDRLPGPVASLTAQWMRGHRDDVARGLETLAPPRTALGRQVAANLAIGVDRAELVAKWPGAEHPVVRARAAWHDGDVSGALAALEGSRTSYAEVLRGERALLEPGMRLHCRAPRPTPLHAAPRGEDDPIRVLHVLTNSLPHTQSGYTLRTHSILKAQRDLGIEVKAVTRVGYPVTVGKLGAQGIDVVDGIEYHRILPARLARTMPKRLAQQAAAMMPLIEEFRPHVLHTTTNYTNAIVTRALAEHYGIPWAYEVRGMLEKTWAASKATPEAQERAAASERFTLVQARETELACAADAVFTLSGVMRDELVERGVPAEKISIVPNSIDESLLEFAPTREECRAELGLPQDAFLVGAVSSLVDYEGHDLVLEAVAMLRDEGLDVRAVIVGDGVARPRLLKLADELGLGDAAILPGRLPKDVGTKYVRALDVVTVYRRDTPVTRSVTPLKPIEAMALGTLVIMSDLPPLVDLARASSLPHWTRTRPTAAALTSRIAASLTDSIDKAAAARARGREYASARTWTNAVGAHTSIYAKLVAQ